jgi:hypothetical protein
MGSDVVGLTFAVVRFFGELLLSPTLLLLLLKWLLIINVA